VAWCSKRHRGAAASEVVFGGLNKGEIHPKPKSMTMKPILVLFLAASMLPGLRAQTKTAHEYYADAKAAHGLPTLPYVCFRTTTEDSQDWKEKAYEDPTFVMLGSTKQIAETIKKTSYAQMTGDEKAKFEKFQNTDLLYMQPFDHGVAADSKFFARRDPNDPSRAVWVFEGKVGEKNRDFTWEFNINWGTLQFKETVKIESYSLIYFGSCESIDQ
jgi:hypothetical protein